MNSENHSKIESTRMIVSQPSLDSKSNEEIGHQQLHFVNYVNQNMNFDSYSSNQDPLHIIVEIDEGHEESIQLYTNGDYISTIKDFCKKNSISLDKEEFLILSIKNQVQKINKMN